MTVGWLISSAHALPPRVHGAWRRSLFPWILCLFEEGTSLCTCLWRSGFACIASARFRFQRRPGRTSGSKTLGAGAFVFPFFPAIPDSETWPPLLFSTIIFTFPHKKTRLIAAFGHRDVPVWLRPSAARQSQQGRGSWTQMWDSVPTLASLLPPEGSY